LFWVSWAGTIAERHRLHATSPAITKLSQQLAAPRMERVAVRLWRSFPYASIFCDIFISWGLRFSPYRDTINLSHCLCCPAILTLCINPQTVFCCGFLSSRPTHSTPIAAATTATTTIITASSSPTSLLFSSPSSHHLFTNRARQMLGSDRGLDPNGRLALITYHMAIYRQLRFETEIRLYLPAAINCLICFTARET